MNQRFLLSGLASGMVVAGVSAALVQRVSVGHALEEEIAAALVHAQNVSPEVVRQTRYLTLYNVVPQRRDELYRTVNFVTNSTSRERVIRRVERVTATLLAVNIEHFAFEPGARDEWTRAWDVLAAAEPYFAVWFAGSSSSLEVTRATNGDQRGEMTTRQVAQKLQALTGSSRPLVRADYFVVSAMSTLGGGVYYELAGIPITEEKWFQLTGMDLKTVTRVRAMEGANLSRSGVTGKPRRIVRLQSALGGSYHTLDSATSGGSRDPLQLPIAADGTFRMQYDAGEYIAPAPNGMLRYALYDAAGNRQDAVPDKIAKDDSDSAGDGILQAAVSCVRCHVEGGLRPFACDFAGLLDSGVELRSTRKELLVRCMEFYDQERLQRRVAFDRQSYEMAVQRAVGQSSLHAAAEFAAVYRRFAYQQVSLEEAAREVDVAPAAFSAILSDTQNPTLLLLLTGRAVNRVLWDIAFQEAAGATSVVHTAQ
jgi:hypothetical protein